VKDQTQDQIHPSARVDIAEIQRLAETWTPQHVLSWAFETFGNEVAISSAFGAEGMALIDMALDAFQDHDVKKEFASSVDSNQGSVLKVVEQAFAKADETTLKRYFEWKHPERGELQQWTYEQKKELFGNFSLWYHQQYMTLLQSMKDFDRFTLEMQSDPSMLKKICSTDSIEGHGSAAQFIERHAKGVLESYRGRGQNEGDRSGERVLGIMAARHGAQYCSNRRL